jgi:ABC-type antimicrobial peptide transport system permease subunit
MILMNSRKYEIAVLRSVGMKKSRIIVNYLIENLAFIWGLTLIALIAAQFISRIFTGMIFRDIQDLVSPEIFKQLTRSANLELILQNTGLVFGGTAVVVILSLILACINIIRFEPLKIFNKRY